MQSEKRFHRWWVFEVRESPFMREHRCATLGETQLLYHGNSFLVRPDAFARMSTP